jgi:hypothetical protein
MVNDNSGFWALGGQFHNANFPTGASASPPVDQLLGVNGSPTISFRPLLCGDIVTQG